MFFVKSSENVPGCPCCGGQLRYRDSRLRIRKHEGGNRDFLSIRRFKCTTCESYHNELPDVLLPYKHYEAEVISGVIDGIVTPHDQDSEDYPSISTMFGSLSTKGYTSFIRFGSSRYLLMVTMISDSRNGRCTI